MIYLIGIDHLIQYNNGIVPEDIFIEFKSYLKDIAGAIKNTVGVNCNSPLLNIGLFAEEFSEEALRRVYNATEATVKSVADKMGIEHRFCDPEEPDRIKLGIPYFAEIRDSVKRKYGISGKYIIDHDLRKKIEGETIEISKTYWSLREEFWFTKISDKIQSDIIFICGHEHIARFKSLLNDKGCDCSILNAFWKKEIFSDYKKLSL